VTQFSETIIWVKTTVF